MWHRKFIAVELALFFPILMLLLPHSNVPQLEKQIHEDEEFARTLAMLDKEPQAKKVIYIFNTNECSLLLSVVVKYNFACVFV